MKLHNIGNKLCYTLLLSTNLSTLSLASSSTEQMEFHQPGQVYHHRSVRSFPRTIDLADFNSTQGTLCQGAASNDVTGYSVSTAGDFNNDGITDVIIGAISASPQGRSGAGTAYVVYGKANGYGIGLDLSTLTASQGLVIQGAVRTDDTGVSVSAAGDFNNDGIDDVIVGAYFASPQSRSDAGNAYIIYGKTGGYGTNTLDLLTLTTTQGLIIQGAVAGDRTGNSVSAAGDFNNDGIDDIIIGAYLASPQSRTNAGNAYVIYGKTAGYGTNALDLLALTATQGLMIQGAVSGVYTGNSVSTAGDFNNDGIADVIIGAPLGRGSAGQAYIIYGKNGGYGTTTLDLASLTATQGVAIQGATNNDRTGNSVSAAGDVNNDSIDDVIVGAYFANPQSRNTAGLAYIIYGQAAYGATLNLNSLTSTQGLVIQGALAGDSIGSSVSAAGDTNNDSIADVIIGAEGGSPQGRSGAGEAYIIYGQMGGYSTTTLDLSTLTASQGLLIQGAASDGYYNFDNTGNSVSTAGDFNKDGIVDVIIGASGATPRGRNQAGEAYIVYGQSAAQSTPTMTFAVSMTGSAANSTTAAMTPSITVNPSYSGTPSNSNSTTNSITPSSNVTHTAAMTPSITVNPSYSSTPSHSNSTTNSATSSSKVTHTAATTPSFSTSLTNTDSSSIGSTITGSLPITETPSASVSDTGVSTPNLSTSLSSSDSVSVSSSSVPSLTTSNTISSTGTVTPSLSTSLSNSDSLSVSDSTTPLVTTSPTISNTGAVTPSISNSLSNSNSKDLSASNSPAIVSLTTLDTDAATFSPSTSQKNTNSHSIDSTIAGTLSMTGNPSASTSNTGAVIPNSIITASIMPTVSHSVPASSSEQSTTVLPPRRTTTTGKVDLTTTGRTHSTTGTASTGNHLDTSTTGQRVVTTGQHQGSTTTGMRTTNHQSVGSTTRHHAGTIGTTSKVVRTTTQQHEVGTTSGIRTTGTHGTTTGSNKHLTTMTTGRQLLKTTSAGTTGHQTSIATTDIIDTISHSPISSASSSIASHHVPSLLTLPLQWLQQGLQYFGIGRPIDSESKVFSVYAEQLQALKNSCQQLKATAPVGVHNHYQHRLDDITTEINAQLKQPAAIDQHDVNKTKADLVMLQDDFLGNNLLVYSNQPFQARPINLSSSFLPIDVIAMNVTLSGLASLSISK